MRRLNIPLGECDRHDLFFEGVPECDVGDERVRHDPHPYGNRRDNRLATVVCVPLHPAKTSEVDRSMVNFSLVE